MRFISALICVAVFTIAACMRVSDHTARPTDGQSRKIEFDLSAIDDDGLRGPPDGKVSVTYEFAIPDRPDCKAEVTKIDPSIQIGCGVRGRVGAKPGECLCTGSTHQKNYRQILQRLAELPYVARIVECFFEK